MEQVSEAQEKYKAKVQQLLTKEEDLKLEEFETPYTEGTVLEEKPLIGQFHSTGDSEDTQRDNEAVELRSRLLTILRTNERMKDEPVDSDGWETDNG